MRVLICGARNLGRANAFPSGVRQDAVAAIERSTRERAFVCEKLDLLHATFAFHVVICGREGGAERLGRQWAEVRNIPVTTFDRITGRFRSENLEARNLRMLTDGKPDLCVAFGQGELTPRMLRHAKERGIEMMLFEPQAALRVPVPHR